MLTPYCIKCGYPISELPTSPPVDNELAQILLELKDANDFSIGRQIMNWTGGAVLKNATMDIDQNELGVLETGKVELYIHKNGI